LNPQAETLVRAARVALSPPGDNRERVFQALSANLGGALSAESSLRTSVAAREILVKAAAVLAGLGVVVGALYLASPRSESPTMALGATAGWWRPPPPSISVPATTLLVTPKAAVAGKTPPRFRSADHLAQEVAILSRAGADLHAGRPADALLALEEHQRRFPGGTLAEERMAARVRVLCVLGRMNEAEDELARLVRSAPRSPHVTRARKACGLAPTGER
jgi:hypothetical protein